MNMEEMMKQCCGEGGMPNVEKMKQFMAQCGKTEFSDAEMKMIEQCCGKEGMPDMREMQALMEKCGCKMPTAA
jgi:hypothetical protein